MKEQGKLWEYKAFAGLSERVARIPTNSLKRLWVFQKPISGKKKKVKQGCMCSMRKEKKKIIVVFTESW